MGSESLTSKLATSYDLTLLRTRSVADFLSEFCRIQLEVIHLRFATYAPEPKLSERLHNILTPEEAELRDQAVEVCRGNGIPFWDALLGICIKRDAIPERFLESAADHTFHRPAQLFELSREEVSPRRISEMIAQLPDGLGLVVCSRLQLKSGDVAHIPMLDFRCPYSEGNAQAIRKILTLLGQKTGVIAESGRSYHYYGTELLSPADWVDFMARALLFAPVTDPRYIAHRLRDGECRLKIVASRDSAMPVVVDAYSNSN